MTPQQHRLAGGSSSQSLRVLPARCRAICRAKVGNFQKGSWQAAAHVSCGRTGALVVASLTCVARVTQRELEAAFRQRRKHHAESVADDQRVPHYPAI
jgi:hypothetical protein